MNNLTNTLLQLLRAALEPTVSPPSIPRLTEELNATGYNKYRQCYLKQEVEIIVKYMGEP